MSPLLPPPPRPAPTRRYPALWLKIMAFVAAISSHGGAHAEDQALGRLFFTPERRVALDRQRDFNVDESRVVEGANLTLNGVVRRSSGKSTVWINGVPYDNQATSTEVQSRINRHDLSRVTLKAGDEAPASLKVGESINRATGEKGDGLEGGTIVIRRARSRGGRSAVGSGD